MTRCKKQVIYLAGAIDTVADRGLGWRRLFEAALIKIGIDVIVPNDMEEQKLPPQHVVKLKAKKDLHEFKCMFRKHIILPDISAMDSCDMVVVRWDGESIAGTAHECGHAFMKGQPVLLVTPREFGTVPNWLLACCEREFHTLRGLIKHLKTRKTQKRN
jgi:nucleoside 2-deoxyribosyltransferase